jgi:lipoyl(octanoyl) transferase
MFMKSCRAAWLGCIPYEEAWRMQEKFAGEIARNERPETLMLLEHPHTFTAGRSTRPGHLLWNEEERRRRDVTLYEVDRGGDITYHGPGQLVGYPLFRLPPLASETDQTHGTDTIGYIRKIEAALIRSLADFGINGCRREGFTGVWVENSASANKIASIGVKVDVNRITRHGFALNVDPDMSYWGGIIACGIQGVAMTSMASCLGGKIEMGRVVDSVIRAFATTFETEIAVDHSF